MVRTDAISTAPPDTHPAPEPSAGSIQQSSQALPPSPALDEKSPDHFHGWETIGEQGLYDEEGFLYPSCNLTSEKLKDRKEDDVVIFNYSLGRADGNPPVEGGGPSSGSSGEVGDMFFQVSKNKLIESEQFNQVINLTKEPRSIHSRARLAIIDFPQCYDAYDDNLLNPMAKGLHLPNPDTFRDAHSKRVLTLPGRGRFRTGFLLRVPSKTSSELAKSGSSGDRITLFVSFPYFGKSGSSSPLGLESESVELLDFKRLGVGVPDRSVVVSGGDKDDIGEILVHQARYMIFDNCTMATFRSKEDSAKDRVPLHPFQERIGAFGAMIQMIANRMDSDLWAFGKLQVSLCKLEEDIDHIISDAKIYEDNQGMEGIPDDHPQGLPPSIVLTEEQMLAWNKYYEEARQNKVRRRKQRRVRDLLASLNGLSASLFAVINVAERQLALLYDLHSLSEASCQTGVKNYERGYPLYKNPFYKNIAPIPILSGNSEHIWPNTLDAINDVIRERKCFVKKVKKLVGNMDIRRKILSAFLKSNQAEASPAEKVAESMNIRRKTANVTLFETTTQEATDKVKLIEGTAKETQAEIVQRGRAGDGFGLLESAVQGAAGVVKLIEGNTKEAKAEILEQGRTGDGFSLLKRTAQAIDAVKPTETQAEPGKQGRTMDGFSIFTLALLPLSLCTSTAGQVDIECKKKNP